jgi:hypothetical protein
MTGRSVRLILRADAVLHVLIGPVLLSATWTQLYETLDLPQAKPELFVQVGGAVLLGLAYLLWVAPRDAAMTRYVAATAAAVKGGVILLILSWFAFGDLGIETRGTVLLAIVALVLAAFAVLEASFVLRRGAGAIRPG